MRGLGCLLLGLCALEGGWGEPVLDLSCYLGQVEKNNEEFISMKLLRGSYEEISLEGSLLFTPKLQGLALKNQVGQPRLLPLLPTAALGSELINDAYTVGISQKTPIGLEWAVLSVYQFTQLKNPVSFGVPLEDQDKVWASRQILTVKQPLWKNGFGEKFRAQVEHAKSAALAQSHMESFKLRRAQAQAENVYWKLVLARELRKLREESVYQAETLVAYVREKRREDLTLESELFQALSLLSVRRLDWEKAKDHETALALTFNAFRGVSSSEVSEKLSPFAEDVFRDFVPKKGIRQDLRAQEEVIRSRRAQDTISTNDLLPELNLFAAVGFTGFSPELSTSFHDSLKGTTKEYIVGVDISIPLAPRKIRTIRRAYENKTSALQSSLNRAKFEHQQQWDELVKQLEENKELLVLLVETEQLQKKNYENMKQEYERGLSNILTLNNVYDEYQNAKIAVLQMFETTLDILSRLALYGDPEQSFPCGVMP